MQKLFDDITMFLMEFGGFAYNPTFELHQVINGYYEFNTLT